MKTTFALEEVPGASPTYEWVLMGRRAPATDVNAWEVEARPLLTVIFIQQAYDIIFYEAEPVLKRTWEEQLGPPLPTVLGARAKGKGKGKDAKGQGKGPWYRGGPAGRADDAPSYVDRPCLIVCLMVGLRLLDFQEPTHMQAPYCLLASGRVRLGGCTAPPLNSYSMHSDRTTPPQPPLQTCLLTGTTGAAKMHIQEAALLKHRGAVSGGKG